LFKITTEEISLEEMIQRAKREDSGAIVTFMGTVRDDGIQMMEVEAFTEAAEAELEQIRLEAIERFGLASVQIAHRTGRLAVGESIVAVVCTAAHRAEAFEGCRYIIDELKKRATIWKKEIGENDERWVGEQERESKRNDWNQEMNGEKKEMNNLRIVLCTASPENGELIAKSLIEEHLAACVNISSVNSCYLWEGKLNLENEALLIIKTEQTRIEKLISKIRELHSYELPEIIVLPIIDGYQPYLDWISQSVDSSR
jgi:molybdopterin synthase catalytic subunit/uncharacterized protein involved in tolerance to divalent cations